MKLSGKIQVYVLSFLPYQVFYIEDIPSELVSVKYNFYPASSIVYLLAYCYVIIPELRVLIVAAKKIFR